MKKIIPVFLIIGAIALVFTGLILKQNSIVFVKAIKVCLECVGIG